MKEGTKEGRVEDTVANINDLPRWKKGRKEGRKGKKEGRQEGRKRKKVGRQEGRKEAKEGVKGRN